MRSLGLFALVCSSLALADSSVSVAPNNLLRLPGTTGLLVLDRLEVGDAGTLLVPATINEIRVGQLVLGRDAHIGIAPGGQAFRLEARQTELGAGSQVSARGATGTAQKPATPGRDLSLRLEHVQIADLTLDVRGGAGAPGHAGLDGADGEAGGCTWGQASRGDDGQNGGDGQAGAPGGQIRLEVPEDFDAERLTVRLDGGRGGDAGIAGLGGRGGAAKGCWLYSTDSAGNGRPGQAGQPGAVGREGALNLVRFAGTAE